MPEKINPNVPDTWYKYDFPLTQVPGAPIPSQADYAPQNCAWMIEMFAAVLGQEPSGVTFVYENNTPDNESDNIIVQHPGDKLYWPDYNTSKLGKSPELLRYEERAKSSDRLKLFEENSPAGIRYFRSIR